MSVTVDTRRLNQLMHSVDDDIADVIKTIGFTVEGLAKIKAPVDTGALESSIFVRIKNDNGEPEHRPGVNYVKIPEPRTKLEVNVGPSVEYGIFVELGTNRSSAQPFLVPAVREVEQGFSRYKKDFGKALGDG